MEDKDLFSSSWYQANYQPHAAITKCPKSLIFILAFFLFFSVGRNTLEIDGFALLHIVKDQFSVPCKPRLGQEGTLGCITLHFTFSDHALLSWRMTLLIKALRYFHDPCWGSLLGPKLHAHRFQHCHVLLVDLLQMSSIYLQVKLLLVRWHSCLTHWKQYQKDRALFKLPLWLVRGKQYKFTTSIVLIPVFMLVILSTNFSSSVLCAPNAPE